MQKYEAVRFFVLLIIQKLFGQKGAVKKKLFLQCRNNLKKRNSSPGSSADFEQTEKFKVQVPNKQRHLQFYLPISFADNDLSTIAQTQESDQTFTAVSTMSIIA